ncbi:GNAT family N-acetyltransferase [Streptomyces erythrochromogenes]|uniref:GNAT family N-acetyltransferase n=1 Tax=Streptomyces erythrochromogenes TaxID=285574 RepID=UPI0037D0F4AE
MNTSVRHRTQQDLTPCVRALAEVHALDGYPLNWPDHPEAWLTPPSLLDAWVAERHGHIAGHIVLSRSGPGDAGPALWSARTGASPDATAVINRLFVAPTARGHRIGAALMARATTEARSRGLHPVLDVLASDTAAAALYERLGWHHLGTVTQQWTPTQTVDVHCYAAAP